LPVTAKQQQQPLLIASSCSAAGESSNHENYASPSCMASTIKTTGNNSNGYTNSDCGPFNNNSNLASTNTNNNTCLNAYSVTPLVNRRSLFASKIEKAVQTIKNNYNLTSGTATVASSVFHNGNKEKNISYPCWYFTTAATTKERS
jgi:hypothetical protein